MRSYPVHVYVFLTDDLCNLFVFIFSEFRHILYMSTAALVALSQSCSKLRSRFALILYSRMTADKALHHTILHTGFFFFFSFLYLWKSMITLFRIGRCLKYFSRRILRLKICSVVLIPALNPVYTSVIISFSWVYACSK